MVNKLLLLSLDPVLFKKLERKAKRLSFTTVQKYIYDILRRSTLTLGGRPKKIHIPEEYLRYASPTKETYKIIRENGGKL